MKQKKLVITENENIVHNSWYTRRDTGMNKISGYLKQGYYIPKRQLKTIGQEF